MPRLPNVNLLLGDNGSGKTTLLKAIALAALGPAIQESGLRDANLVRNIGPPTPLKDAYIEANLVLHDQDAGKLNRQIDSHIAIMSLGELEKYVFQEEIDSRWQAVYESKNDKFFIVGYGATRRVERPDNIDMGARTKSSFARVQRVQGLFEDSFSLIPLSYWLPRLKAENPGRYTQVVRLIDRLLGKKQYTFSGEMNDRNDYLFERQGIKVPFHGLSDGYRAYLGWVGDLLYHICYGCPKGKKLVENSGVVMVDEIDLHLHPRWQMEVVKTMAKALPRMQFILTSHSPLIAGSLEWMNVIALKQGPKLTSSAKRIRESIHGLDADQVLLTEFFGLSTTRTATKENELNRLSMRARHGDKKAAIALVQAMSRGAEKA